MPPRLRDSVHRCRAIFIDARHLARVDEKTIDALRWLGRFYRLAAIGGPLCADLARAGIAADAVPAGGVQAYVRAHSIEAYASWLVGSRASSAFRTILPDPSGSAVKALRAIRRAETRSRIIIDEELLGQRVAAMRRSGRRIVFTNGVFDLLHVGHVRLLENARRLGDRLIVGINSDDSTRAIKGSARPVIPQFARAELLASLRAVDCCFIFTGLDPMRVLTIVRPDVLAKGADYTMNRIVGARFVRGYGGRVERLPLVDGVSTTSTIQGMGGSEAHFTSPG
jgi:rfaE bifunctional protein nucleotidyltransferase chain/domain